MRLTDIGRYPWINWILTYTSNPVRSRCYKIGSIFNDLLELVFIIFINFKQIFQQLTIFRVILATDVGGCIASFTMVSWRMVVIVIWLATLSNHGYCLLTFEKCFFYQKIWDLFRLAIITKIRYTHREKLFLWIILYKMFFDELVNIFLLFFYMILLWNFLFVV